MAKFEIKVHRTDTYEIEVDENIINDKWIKDFESYMWDVDEDCPHEDLAKYIGEMRARYGSYLSLEGFGWIPVEGEYLTDIEKARSAQGFKMKVISEDQEIETEARSLNND